MRPRRRTVVLLLAAAVLFVLAFLFWPEPPSPQRQIYDQLALGMTEADVLQLLPAQPITPENVGMIVTLDWQRQAEGQVSHVRLAGGDPEIDRVFWRAHVFHQCDRGTPPHGMADADYELVSDRAGIYQHVDRQTGEMRYTHREWRWAHERIAVLFDMEGVAREKSYVRIRQPPWWEMKVRTLLRLRF